MKKKKIIFTLDAGSSKTFMIMAIARLDQKLEIIASGFSNSGGVNKGIVVDASQVAASIRNSAAELQMKSGVAPNRVVAGISGSHIKSHDFHSVVEVKGKHGEVNLKDLQNAIRAASIPLSDESSIIHEVPRDFVVNQQGGIVNPVGMSGSQLAITLHVVSCNRDLCQSLINAANKAQIGIQRVLLQSLASGEAVLTPEEKDLGAVVIDIGGGTTDIAIFEKSTPCFTSVIPVGGEHFTRDLVEVLRVSREEAERIKVNYGNVQPGMIAPDEIVTVQGLGTRGAFDLPRAKICEILHARGAELLEMAREAIINSGVSEKLIAGAILTGGGSMMKGMLDLADSILQTPVRQGIPLGFKGQAQELSHPAYSCAIGLALLEAERWKQRNAQSKFAPRTLIDRAMQLFD